MFDPNCDRCVTTTDGTRYACQMHRHAPQPEMDPGQSTIVLPGHVDTFVATISLTNNNE
jgi:hypothetical protein